MGAESASAGYPAADPKAHRCGNRAFTRGRYERGGGRAIDELVVQLPDEALVPLLVTEISEVDGVDVEDVRRVADGPPSRSSESAVAGDSGPDDVAWAPLPTADLALVLGRRGRPFRARERRQAAALARIADRRWRDLARPVAHPTAS